MPRKLKLSFLILTITCGMWVFKEHFNLLEYRYKDKIEYDEHDFSNYNTMYKLIKSKYSNKKVEICELIQNT